MNMDTYTRSKAFAADTRRSPLMRFWQGKTGRRRADGRCSDCGASNFRYHQSGERSEDGVRGYPCVLCGTVKPEREADHSKDADCSFHKIDGVCTVCGVLHADPCPDCGERGY